MEDRNFVNPLRPATAREWQYCQWATDVHLKKTRENVAAGVRPTMLEAHDFVDQSLREYGDIVDRRRQEFYRVVTGVLQCFPSIPYEVGVKLIECGFDFQRVLNAGELLARSFITGIQEGRAPAGVVHVEGHRHEESFLVGVLAAEIVSDFLRAREKVQASLDHARPSMN